MTQRRSAQLKETESDDDPMFSQPSTTQAQRALETFTSAQISQKAAEVVQFILVKDQKKIPIRRTDLMRLVVKEYRHCYNEIMKRATTIFEQVFGFKLVIIDPKMHVYLLVNKLDSAEGEAPIKCPTDPKMGLLFAILSVIDLKGGSVTEAFMWNFLKKLGVDPMEKHKDFGDVKKLVTFDFVRQRYLEITKIPHTDPVENDVRWGQRAELEMSKPKMQEFLEEIYEQHRPANTQHTNSQPSTSQASTSSHR